MAKFINPGEEIDVGQYGYATTMRVIAVHAVTAEWLEEKQFGRMQAQALVDSNAWHVHCAENDDGTGLINDIYMHEDDAAHFAVGDEVIYHHKRDSVPGYGELAYIEREPKVLRAVPA